MQCSWPFSHRDTHRSDRAGVLGPRSLGTEAETRLSRGTGPCNLSPGVTGVSTPVHGLAGPLEGQDVPDEAGGPKALW